jgi:D-alanyl-D-alanine carboxypeptidase (penicillin-binding protein 5/6)
MRSVPVSPASKRPSILSLCWSILKVMKRLYYRFLCALVVVGLVLGAGGSVLAAPTSVDATAAAQKTSSIWTTEIITQEATGTPAAPAASGETTAALYFTYAPPKIVAKTTLPVYSSTEFNTAHKTATTIAKGKTVTVTGYELSGAGLPCLQIPGGYITAAKTKVKLVPVYVPKKARAAFALDAVTGKVLYKKNAGKGYPVASIAKLMTVLLVREKLASNKRLNWKTKIKIKHAGLTKMSKSPDCGGFVLKKGASYTVSGLYKTTLIESSNASAIALGMWVSGTNAKFVKLMNKRAKQLGLKHTTFVSASGLDNADLKRFGFKVKGTKAKATNKVSAEDVAKIARELLTKYPDVVNTTKLAKVKVAGKTVKSTNSLLPGKRYYVASLKVDGLKTGTTRSAGSCLVATGQVEGKNRIITVLLHDTARFPDTNKLMQSIYDHFVLKP